MKYHQPLVKRIGMSVFAWTVSAVTRRPVTDPTSGFQALNADAMRFLCRDNYPVDYPDADTLLVLHYAGFKTHEVPVTMRERISGVSMHSGWKPFYYVGKMWLAIAMVLLRQGTHIALGARAGSSRPGGSGSMIDPRTRATMFVVGLFVLAFVINMMRTRKLQERYALLWVLAAVGLMLAPFFITAIDQLAYALGVAYPPALLLALSVIALMLIVLQLSLSISHQADQIKMLTQELGLLRQELEELRPKPAPVARVQVAQAPSAQTHSVAANTEAGQ